LSSASNHAKHLESFETFYRREFGGIVAIVRALVRDGAAAEDLAQDTFIAANRHWPKVSGYDEPRAWVRRVAINKATSYLRWRGADWRATSRVGRQMETTIPEMSPAGDEVWREVRRLPRRQAQAVVLHYVGQLTMVEIAEVMKCSTGAVKSHLSRARSTLSNTLSDWSEETS
jgi:RNA polymerase sigma-70 factor (ECF subfamily)